MPRWSPRARPRPGSAGKPGGNGCCCTTTAVYHVIAAHRSAAVVSDFLGGAIPEVWVADRYAAQAGHGAQRQVCLAHLFRDAQFAIDAGDAVFAAGFRKLLLRSIAIGQRRADLKDTTLVQYRADLDRRLDRLLAVAPTVPAGRKLAAASPNAAAISLSSSLDATFPTPTTGANGHCGPASSFAKSPAASDPAGALASTPQPFPSSLPGPPLQRPFRPPGHSRYPRRPVHPCTSLSTGVSSYDTSAQLN